MCLRNIWIFQERFPSSLQVPNFRMRALLHYRLLEQSSPCSHCFRQWTTPRRFGVISGVCLFLCGPWAENRCYRWTLAIDVMLENTHLEPQWSQILSIFFILLISRSISQMVCSYFEFIKNVETCILSGCIDTYWLSLTLPLGSPNLTYLLSGSYRKHLQTPAVEVGSGPPTCDCHRWGWPLTCCGPSQIHEILVLEFSLLQPEKNGPRFPTGTHWKNL